MLNLAVIGTGYVGLVSALCFAKLGHKLCCFDHDLDKILKLKQGLLPIYEPGLEDLWQETQSQGLLSFSSNIKDLPLLNAHILIIAVGTPMDDQGKTDLSYINAVVQDVISLPQVPPYIIIKSTVPAGTNAWVQKVLNEAGCSSKVISNPEFLREGRAIDDFMRPDRIIIGTDQAQTYPIIDQLYESLLKQGFPLLTYTWEEAELIKYAANSFLAIKISFINLMANMAEKLGGDVDHIAQGMGLDPRIGKDFLKAGPGFGGSCFPKDSASLIAQMQDLGIDPSLIQAMVDFNNQRKEQLISYVQQILGDKLQGTTVALLGLAFKAGTDDLRDSPVIPLIQQLKAQGVRIQAHDPKAMDQAQKHPDFQDIHLCSTKEQALEKADLGIIVTEWPEYKNWNTFEIGASMNQRNFLDLRGIVSREAFESQGFKLIILGKSLQT